MESNNTNFPIGITNILQKEEYDKNKQFLKYHQFVTKNYVMMQKNRGILCYYETGMGKTYLSAAISEAFLSERNILILTAKSLASNFKNSLSYYLTEIMGKSQDEAEKIIAEKYNFISSNSSNMINQINKIGRSSIFEEQLADINREFSNTTLENFLVIIDEAHNLFNSITNGSKMAVALYDMILKTKNVKSIFLSGTPIINNPFEISCCFNMLHDKPYFPEVKQDFDEWFVDENELKIKNRDKLSNYMVGKISYYGSKFLNTAKRKSDFPEEKPVCVVKILMSEYQYSLYTSAREVERKEASKQYSKPASLSRFGMGDKSQSSTYRVRSRQISNFAFPKEILSQANMELDEIPKNIKDIQKQKRIIKFNMLQKLSINDLALSGNLRIFSPKMEAMIKDINREHKDNRYKGLVYSGFVTSEGLGVFSKALEANGWQEYSIKGVAGGYEDELKSQLAIWDDTAPKAVPVKGGNNKKTFAIISGNVHPDDRNIIIDVMNSKDNIRGEIISLLLISSTGAEGLDLSGIRFIMLMEGYWNNARIKQIIARGVRYKSHSDLPENERSVYPYIYLSDYPKNIHDTLREEEETTDIHIWNSALKNQILIDEFLNLMIESSIDCEIHKKRSNAKIKCKLCVPTNKPLYISSISMQKDLRLPNNCKRYTEDDMDESGKREISAKELILDGGRKVYYTVVDGSDNILERIKVFEYDDNLNAHVEVDEDDPLLPIILEKIVVELM